MTKTTPRTDADRAAVLYPDQRDARITHGPERKQKAVQQDRSTRKVPPAAAQAKPRS